jgi:uncharacterized protein
MKSLIFFISVFFLNFTVATAQPIPSEWEGEIPSTIKYTVAFQFEKDSSLVMHSPGQGSFNIKCTELFRRDDSIFFRIPSIQARFEGRYQPASNQFTGRWKQGTLITPLDLRSVNLRDIYGKERPQHPQPPFPYISEDYIYYNKDSSVTLGATLTKPSGKGPFPAVILSTGSGQQDRDETMLGHKPFAVIADYLTRRGFMVLRVDDRGVGKSKGDLKNATTASFADDVETSLNFLLKQKDVNIKKIGIIGHSEGGMIAPMVAVRRKEIAFIIMLAGPATPVIDLMTEQNTAIRRRSGYPEEDVAGYSKFYKKLVTAITQAPNDSIALQEGVKEFNAWRAVTKETTVTTLTGITPTGKPETFVKVFVTQLGSAWWKFFLKYDPQPTLRKLNCKVLALNGGEDIQVMPSSLETLKSVLKNSGVKKLRTVELPGLNHLFQKCHYCTAGEYGQLKETFSISALEEIGKWLKEEVVSQ